ncbi:MAG: O-antigen ligase family protein [Limnobacter sp.]|nr:O-antigen ligase family protein [Limnobacter sp.]
MNAGSGPTEQKPLFENAQQQYEDTISGRMQPSLVALARMDEHPWLGAGAGTFQWFFTRYEGSATPFDYFKYAHSDPIQFVMEAGWFGLVLCGLLLAAPLAAGCAALRGPTVSLRAKVLVPGMVVGVVAVMLHSLIDFPLQLFGVVLPLIAVLNCLMLLELPSERQPVANQKHV